MGWLFKTKSDKLEAELRTLKGKLFQAEIELRAATQKLLDARISATKVRSRARTLREERRRLRALLEQHNIPWAHDGVSRAEATST